MLKSTGKEKGLSIKVVIFFIVDFGCRGDLMNIKPRMFSSGRKSISRRNIAERKCFNMVFQPHIERAEVAVFKRIKDEFSCSNGVRFSVVVMVELD